MKSTYLQTQSVVSAPTTVMRALMPIIGTNAIIDPSSERREELGLLEEEAEAPLAVAEPEPEPEPDALPAGEVPVAAGEDWEIVD